MESYALSYTWLLAHVDAIDDIPLCGVVQGMGHSGLT
jgi:hypothetical protein